MGSKSMQWGRGIILPKKKKKFHRERKVQKSSQITHSPQIFRHSSLFWKKLDLVCSSQQQQHARLSRRSKPTHDVYNKKELSIISRSNKMMMMMCVNCCCCCCDCCCSLFSFVPVCRRVPVSRVARSGVKNRHTPFFV